MKITAVGIERLRLPLDPPFYAAWDPVPRRHFDATLVRVDTDEGFTGYGSAACLREWQATAEIYADPSEAELLRQSLREADEGKVTPWEYDDASA